MLINENTRKIIEGLDRTINKHTRSNSIIAKTINSIANHLKFNEKMEKEKIKPKEHPPSESRATGIRLDNAGRVSDLINGVDLAAILISLKQNQIFILGG